MPKKSTTLSPAEAKALLQLLKNRFEKNMGRHKGIEWKTVEDKLLKNLKALWSLQQMEDTGGEPDVVAIDKKNGAVIFMDCAAESPKGRRSICYDKAGLQSRKEFKPENNAMDMAKEMGIEILTEEEYRYLQTLGKFDTKTSSWLQTPDAIRKLGGAIFGDCRYNHVFIYHNGAQSYYGGRGFRGKMVVG